MSKIISLFPHIKETKIGSETTIELFMRNIQSGHWQDLVLPVRTASTPEEKRARKEKLPYATISGTFSERKNAGLKEHSDRIAIDVDGVEDPEALKLKLKNDPYIEYAFNSASAKGLCLIFIISGKKHAESFEGIMEYLFNTYCISIDISCKDIARPRYVSYDPFITHNPHAKKFTMYPKKDKIHNPVKVPDVVFVQGDFENMIEQIRENRLDITQTYQVWLQLGFAISHKFGEAGQTYFHSVSENSVTYNHKTCDVQYTNCLKAGREGITIASFYYHAKLAGLQTMSQRTREIVTMAVHAKKGRISQDAAVKNVVQFSGLEDGPDISDIVAQVFIGNVQIDGENDIAAIKIWLKSNHSLLKNVITNRVENFGKPLTDYQVNTIELAIKELFPKTDYSTLSRIMNSNCIPEFNPIKEFFAQNSSRQPVGAIDEFFSCIKATNPQEYVLKYCKKWLVGLIANIFEDLAMSPLMLLLCGRPGTGKTHLFEDLLPTELRQYFATKSLASTKYESGKKDLEIMFAEKILILDDEMAGKSKRDIESIKQLLSASGSNVRAPFDRREQHRKRIATFAGTCNDLEVLNDPNGERRFIPIEVLSIDWKRIDQVDRTDLLMEAFHLYKSGYDFRVLGSDIDDLNTGNERFQALTVEEEMVAKYIRKADDTGVQMTSSDIKNRIEDFHQNLKLDFKRLGSALKKHGFVSKVTSINGAAGRYYTVAELKYVA